VFPALKNVRGGFNLQSSADISANCTTFKGIAGSNNVIKGKFQCISQASAPGNATTSGGGSSGSKKGAATSTMPSASLLGLSGLLALLALAVL
jgi:hypothetical protein